MTTFKVHGAYGTLTVQRGTGLVLGYDPEQGVEPTLGEPVEGEYADIFRFDIPEWAQTYPAEPTGPDDTCDILDIGFWTRVGDYEPAAVDYRTFQRTGDDGCFDASQLPMG